VEGKPITKVHLKEVMVVQEAVKVLDGLMVGLVEQALNQVKQEILELTDLEPMVPVDIQIK
jgi:hypothetical protein